MRISTQVEKIAALFTEDLAKQEIFADFVGSIYLSLIFFLGLIPTVLLNGLVNLCCDGLHIDKAVSNVVFFIISCILSLTSVIRLLETMVLIAIEGLEKIVERWRNFRGKACFF